MENISKHISFAEAVKSNTAMRLNIDNTPGEYHLGNMTGVATNIFEIIEQIFQTEWEVSLRKFSGTTLTRMSLVLFFFVLISRRRLFSSDQGIQRIVLLGLDNAGKSIVSNTKTKTTKPLFKLCLCESLFFFDKQQQYCTN